MNKKLNKIKKIEEFYDRNKLFEICDVKIDHNLFKKNFPKYYSKFIKAKKEEEDLHDFQYISEAIVTDDDSTFGMDNAHKIFKPIPVVNIHLLDGSKQFITSNCIISYNGFMWEDHEAHIIDNRFVLIIVIGVSLQSGSVGIWDINLNNWCFTHSCFPIIEFSYDRNLDEFNFKQEFYASINQAVVEENFTVDKYRNIIDGEKQSGELKSRQS